MIDVAVIDGIKRKFNRLESELDERGRRCWAANEALELGHGGIKAVAQATGYLRAPFSARHQQMEQDRASDVLPYH